MDTEVEEVTLLTLIFLNANQNNNTFLEVMYTFFVRSPYRHGKPAYCCVESCWKNSKSKHRFPNPSKVRTLFDRWVNVYGNWRLMKEMLPEQVYNNYRVCSLHFLHQDFGNNQKLKKGVVPSVKLPGSYESFQLLPRVTQKIKNQNMEQLKVKNFESCRLCLAEIQDSNITLLDGIIKDMLEIILPELNMSICVAPAICKTCLETLKQSYNFKSSCLEVEDKVQDFVNPKSPTCIDLKQILKKHNNIFQISENHVICRTCLGLGEESTSTKLCSYDGDPLKNMVEKCLPELGIELTKDPIICPVCLEQLEEQFHFIMQCLDTEEKINYYCERKNSFKQIDLHSVYLFSMMEDNEDMEKQYGAMENGNLERVCTTVTIEDNSNRNDVMRQQGVQDNIKSSQGSLHFVDLTEDIFAGNIKKDTIKNDFYGQQESNHPQDNIKVHLFEHRPVQQIDPPTPTEEVTFEISKDGNGEDIITSTTTRIRNDDENSDVSITSEHALLTTRFVEKVPSVAKNRKHGIKGKKSGGLRKEKIEYKDDDGGEASDDSSRPKKRLSTRKCKLCNFKTKYTSRMKAHMTVNHSGKSKEKDQNGETPKKVNNKHASEPDPNPKIKCRRCLYKTTDPEEFKKHKQSHLKEKQKKCHICGVTFLRPGSLARHLRTHDSTTPTKANETSPSPTTFTKIPQKTYSRLDPVKQSTQKHSFKFSGQFLKMFKCQICPYQTRMRSNLVKHSLTHKNATEIINHKCKLCNFNTIHKESFLSHMQSHIHDSENQVKKCFLCSFQPKTEEALKNHVNMVHKSGTG